MTPDSIRKSKRVFHGKRLDVRLLPISGARGRRVEMAVVVHPGAVVILPLLDEKTVVMIRNQRAAVGETLLELPAGTLEPVGERPLVCAKRELIEETGYRAGKMERLLEFYSSPGMCTEKMFAFVARDLRAVGQDLDETERIVVEPVKLVEAIRRVKDGRIKDAKTIATLLYYGAFGA